MKYLSKNKTIRSGFTVVELLIVIVVVAILATISIVVFTGIQQRANNSNIRATASQSIKLVSAYIATNNQYPLVTTGDSCLVPGKTSCTGGGSPRFLNTTLSNNLATIGNLPSSLPDARPDYNGILYSYAASGRTLDGNPLSLVLIYSLQGTNQQCGVTDVLSGVWNEFTTSTSGYYSSSGGYTLCIVAIPGP